MQGNDEDLKAWFATLDAEDRRGLRRQVGLRGRDARIEAHMLDLLEAALALLPPPPGTAVNRLQ